MDIEGTGLRIRQDAPHSNYSTMAGCSKHDNELLYYTKRGQFLDQLRTYKLLKKDSDA
jgi:hypothetical protein